MTEQEKYEKYDYNTESLVIFLCISTDRPVYSYSSLSK